MLSHPKVPVFTIIFVGSFLWKKMETHGGFRAVIMVMSLVLLSSSPWLVIAGDIVHQDDIAPKRPGCDNNFVLVSKIASLSLSLSWFFFLKKQFRKVIAFFDFTSIIIMCFWFWLNHEFCLGLLCLVAEKMEKNWLWS